MSDLWERQPTGRFSGLSDLYARYRPDYPDEAVEFIISHCSLTPDDLIIDVGCGTGISTRVFSRRGLKLIGIEPNADMRERAEAAPVPEGGPAPSYRDGRAEATGLKDGIASLVLCAQSFHWFKPETALQEFHRILKRYGWVALMWNERNRHDAFTAAYGTVIARLPGAPSVEEPRVRAGYRLMESPLFTNAERAVFRNEQLLDQDGLLGRAFSASYAPRDPIEAERFAEALRSVFLRYQVDGRISLVYETSVFVAQRAQVQKFVAR
ncbi:MAG TPA: class I SAM-dependent methyltransferase [Candidatus Obscuribacterales bacterium]